MVIKMLAESELSEALELVLSVFMQFEAPDYIDTNIEQVTNGVRFTPMVYEK